MIEVCLQESSTSSRDLCSSASDQEINRLRKEISALNEEKQALQSEMKGLRDKGKVKIVAFIITVLTIMLCMI